MDSMPTLSIHEMGRNVHRCSIQSTPAPDAVFYNPRNQYQQREIKKKLLNTLLWTFSFRFSYRADADTQQR